MSRRPSPRWTLRATQRLRTSWTSWSRTRLERRLARTLDQLELLEKRSAHLELRLRVHRLSLQAQEQLLRPPLLVGPSTLVPQPPPPEQLWQVPAGPMPLPVLHRPEPEPEPMPPAEDQLQELLLRDLGSPTTRSSSDSLES